MRHYQGTVTPYVLDDSASAEIKALAREFGFVYATRPNRGWYKKSGNLWFGYQISEGDYILLLDADFAPRRDQPGHQDRDGHRRDRGASGATPIGEK